MIAASGSDVTDGFMIKLLAKLNIGGATVYITSTHVCTAMISLAIIIFALIVNRKIKKANVEDTPSGIVNISELIVETLDNFVEGIMGKEAKRFVNYVSTLFIFVLLCNISGVLGLRAPTADYGMTLPLGLITFGMVHYCGIKKNKLKHFTDMCNYYKVPIMFYGNKETLGRAIGKMHRASISVEDEGFSKSITKLKEE